MNQTATRDENGNRHDGMKVKRVREMLKVKQSTLAHALGEDWTQKKVSQLEDKDVIDDRLMEEIAEALKVPVEAIRNFDEEKAVNFIANTFNNSGLFNQDCTLNFNPVDKIVELYESLVRSEKEKVEMLQRMLDERK